MAFCVKCGAEIPEGSGFCPACGNAVPEEREVTEKEINAVFGKGIAAAIMAWFPMTSLVAIILGELTYLDYKDIYKSGVSVDDRLKTGGILSKVGEIAGALMSLFWIFWFIIKVQQIMK